MKRHIGEAVTENGSQQQLTDSSSCLLERRHRIEQEVQRELLAQPHLRFSSLVVRRVANGVCLEGVLETDDTVAAQSSVCGLARRVAGVQDVLNHLVVRHSESELPMKG
jgi:hypothetical protein